MRTTALPPARPVRPAARCRLSPVTLLALPALAVALAWSGPAPAQGTGEGTGQGVDRTMTAVPGTAAVGTYRLVSVDGRPVPLHTGTFVTCREDVLSGAVQLFADGRFVLKTLARQSCAPGEDIRYNEIAWGRWRDQGGRVVLDGIPPEPMPAALATRGYWTGIPLDAGGLTGRVEPAALEGGRVEGRRLVATLPQGEAVFEETDGGPQAAPEESGRG